MEQIPIIYWSFQNMYVYCIYSIFRISSVYILYSSLDIFWYGWLGLLIHWCCHSGPTMWSPKAQTQARNSHRYLNLNIGIIVILFKSTFLSQILNTTKTHIQSKQCVIWISNKLISRHKHKFCCYFNPISPLNKNTADPLFLAIYGQHCSKAPLSRALRLLIWGILRAPH